jgi:molybdopterin molybdotransferase
MAQLTDDCFAFAGPLLPISEMEQLIAQRVTPVSEEERVPLRAAHGRVLAHDIVAGTDLPPFDNSAVDGFAVRSQDLDPAAETKLKVVDRITAGHRPETALRPGGAEDCRVEGDLVLLPPGLKPGSNRRLAGEDVRAGSIILPAGRRLAAQHLALAAAVGLTELPMRRRVRVAIFSTGDEIVEPGSARPGPVLFDANRFLLDGLLERLGAQVTDLGILPDEPVTLSAALKTAAADHDLVLTSGGVSTGEADHVRDAVEAIGRLVFWRVGIKPGRPVAMAVISAGANTSAAFVGLPGNPAAVFVTFVRVVRPLLLRLAGALPEPLLPMPVRAGFAYKKRKDRREYVRVTLRATPAGEVEAIKYPKDGAGIITSLTETDGLVELGEDVTTVAPGTTVGFLSYAALTN